MNATKPGRVLLIDQADGPGRTTATLVASLAARLATLHLVSGADAIGALTSGFAALGREVSRTAEGARLRKAIEAGRAGANGNELWSKLRIGEWVTSMPPAPALDHLRNDLALLLADDLESALEMMPIPIRMSGAEGAQNTEPATFVDCALGLWAFSRELTRAVEAMVAPTLTPPGGVTAEESDPELSGSLLR
ncbi:MAG: hypothetical protein MOB07_17945 [Acidobacteria bacterium]|nr:hypothetical protein [Acidobacteriota bacterium]